ncbi:hypothetical protein Q5752_006240 [Cryptotrichosporon argae]
MDLSRRSDELRRTVLVTSGGWLGTLTVLLADAAGIWDVLVLAAVFVLAWIVLRTSSALIAMILGLAFDVTIPLQYQVHPSFSAYHAAHLAGYWPLLWLGTLAEAAAFVLLHPDLFTLVVCIKTCACLGIWLARTDGGFLTQNLNKDGTPFPPPPPPPSRRDPGFVPPPPPPPMASSTAPSSSQPAGAAPSGREANWRDRLGRKGYSPDAIDGIVGKLNAKSPEQAEADLKRYLDYDKDNVARRNEHYKRENQRDGDGARYPGDDTSRAERGGGGSTEPPASESEADEAAPPSVGSGRTDRLWRRAVVERPPRLPAGKPPPPARDEGRWQDRLLRKGYSPGVVDGLVERLRKMRPQEAEDKLADWRAADKASVRARNEAGASGARPNPAPTPRRDRGPPSPATAAAYEKAWRRRLEKSGFVLPAINHIIGKVRRLDRAAAEGLVNQYEGWDDEQIARYNEAKEKTVSNSSAVRYALQVIDALRASERVQLDVVSSLGWNETYGGISLIAERCRERIWRIGEDVRDWEGACLDSTIISEIVSPAPLVDPRANITFVPQPYHLLAPEAAYESLANTFGSSWEMGLFAHVLPQHMFYPTRLVSNYKAVTYFPRRETDPSLYPKKGRGYSLHRPNLREPTADRPGLDPLHAKSKFRHFWTKTGEKYADDLRFAGVCLFEGWEDGVLDERMAQAMLSGCVVATAPPEVEKSAILRLIIPLTKPPAVDVEVGVPPTRHALPRDQLDAALGSLTEAQLKEKALQSFIFARQRFGAPAGIAGRLRVLERWKAGARGYLFPHAFRQSCESPGTAAWCE